MATVGRGNLVGRACARQVALNVTLLDDRPALACRRPSSHSACICKEGGGCRRPLLESIIDRNGKGHAYIPPSWKNACQCAESLPGNRSQRNKLSVERVQCGSPMLSHETTPDLNRRLVWCKPFSICLTHCTTRWRHAQQPSYSTGYCLALAVRMYIALLSSYCVATRMTLPDEHFTGCEVYYYPRGIHVGDGTDQHQLEAFDGGAWH